MDFESREEMISLICDIFNYSYDEVFQWNDENIKNGYLSALKIIECED